MSVEIKVPALGESVTEATVAKWLVKVGDAVTIDQPLCELETDKVTVEVNAAVAGSIADLAVEEGATIQVGAVLCHLEAGASGTAAAKPAAAASMVRSTWVSSWARERNHASNWLGGRWTPRSSMTAWKRANAARSARNSARRTARSCSASATGQ